MHRYFTALIASVAAAAAASAHFVFVVPAADGKAVTVVFSDSLEPDENVPVAKIAGLKLTAKSAGGKTAPVELKAAEHALSGTFPTAGPQMTYGSVTYGMMSRKDTKPALLVYHPKAVAAGVSAADATIGKDCPLEAVPVTEAGKTRFRLLAAGKPVVAAEGSVVLPDGKKEKLKTDADGYTQAFAGTGRYGVWLRNVAATAGDHGGEKYEEVRHYATLVADVK